jgi:rubrerythrin
MPEDEMEQLMEGQIKVNDVIAWAQDQPLLEVLEYAIGLEAGVYDLYSRLKDIYKDSPSAQNVYATLAKEEKYHLDRFTGLLEKHTG